MEAALLRAPRDVAHARSPLGDRGPHLERALEDRPHAYLDACRRTPFGDARRDDLVLFAVAQVERPQHLKAAGALGLVVPAADRGTRPRDPLAEAIETHERVVRRWKALGRQVDAARERDAVQVRLAEVVPAELVQHATARAMR